MPIPVTEEQHKHTVQQRYFVSGQKERGGRLEQVSENSIQIVPLILSGMDCKVPKGIGYVSFIKKSRLARIFSIGPSDGTTWPTPQGIEEVTITQQHHDSITKEGKVLHESTACHSP